MSIDFSKKFFSAIRAPNSCLWLPNKLLITDGAFQVGKIPKKESDNQTDINTNLFLLSI
jgi:hypothetical protein